VYHQLYFILIFVYLLSNYWIFLYCNMLSSSAPKIWLIKYLIIIFYGIHIKCKLDILKLFVDSSTNHGWPSATSPNIKNSEWKLLIYNITLLSHFLLQQTMYNSTDKRITTSGMSCDVTVCIVINHSRCLESYDEF
jgi:hypothetical protein